MKTIIDIIERFKKRKKIALIYKSDFRTFRWSYEKLYSYIKRFANLLKKNNLKKGDRVLIWAPNIPEWVIAHLGTIYYGLVSVPADILSTTEAVDKIAESSRPRLIVKTKFKPSLKFKAKTIYIEDLEFILEDEKEMAKHNAKENELIELVYTSGTTGKPKGVMLSHKNIVSNIVSVTEHTSVTANDQFLSMIPLSHMFEQTAGMMTPLYSGASIIYISSLKPTSIFSALKEENITIIITVPRLLQSLKFGIKRKIGKLLSILMNLAERMPFEKRKSLFSSIHKKFGKNFRFFVSGGAALDEDTENFWNLLGFKVIQGYGLTECSPILTANKEKRIRKQSVGIPVKGVKIKLLDDNEVIAKGPNIFSGYYHDKQKTKEAFRDKWFLTGDIGMIEDGFLFIKGRKKDVIITSAGKNVYPDDIEQVLNEIKGVKESCVIGISKEKGEEVHAVLLTEGRVDIKNIIEKANAKLDLNQRIMSYTLWHETEFPKTSTLKIKKNIVRERIKHHKIKTQKRGYSKIASILAEVSSTPINEIHSSMKLYSDLKIDSIGKVELVSIIEKGYNFDFDEELIDEKTRVRDLEQLIEQRKTVKSKVKYPEWPYSKPIRNFRAFWLQTINFPLLKIFCKIKAEGVKNLKRGPLIFVSNHISYSDHPCILASLPKRLRYNTSAPAVGEFFTPSKKNLLLWLWKRFAYYYVITTLGAFSMPQKHSHKKSFQYAGHLVDKGQSLIIFPEGERTRTKEMLPFKKGTAVLVQNLKIPVIPVGIRGIEKVFPRGAVMPKRGDVFIRFGNPIYFKNESLNEITSKLRDEIEKLRKM